MGNIEIPKSIDGWTLPVIEELVDLDYFETDTYDFKGYLKAEKESREKYNQRLRKTACSFANSNGGFIVFGVADRDSGKRGRDRIVGIEKGDLAKYFGDIISTVEPGIIYIPQNPPIVISNGNRFIFVVHIPKSLRLPHAVLEDSNYVFYKRTNTGSVPMTFPEIEFAFANKTSVISKFILLRTTLVSIQSDLSSLDIINKGEDTSYPITGPNYNMIDLAISDLYPILSSDSKLFLLLSSTSRICKVIDSHVRQLCIDIPIHGKKAFPKFSEAIKGKRLLLESTIKEVLNILEQKYNVTTDPLSKLMIEMKKSS